jgi:hypothetical protein
MEYKKCKIISLIYILSADGTNIDNWTFEEIKEVVAEFVADAS